MQRPKFINGELYHIYNRGVDKRVVFLEDDDYLRAVHDIFEFNDQEPTLDILNRIKKYQEVRLPDIAHADIKRQQRKLLVEVLCYCLMPNHYHFMLRQIVEGGITKFMRKFGTGYTNSFNKKYDRSGSLFQGKFKAVHVKNDAQLLYLPHYIHLNPVDVFQAGWKDNGLRDRAGAAIFLENYRWSSYLDYIGKKNFPSLIQGMGLVLQNKRPSAYKAEVLGWLKKGEIDILNKGITID